MFVAVLIKGLFAFQEWKNETVKQESALKPYEDPVLKPDDIKRKIYDLNREVSEKTQLLHC